MLGDLKVMSSGDEVGWQLLHPSSVAAVTRHLMAGWGQVEIILHIRPVFFSLLSWSHCKVWLQKCYSAMLQTIGFLL